MKTLPVILSVLIPAASFAQAPPVAVLPPPAESKASSPGRRLPQVQFSGADLASVIEFLKAKETAAADAVQNAFLRAIRSLRVLPDESALWAWLARAARSAAVDAKRRSRRYSAMLDKVAAIFQRREPAPEDTEAVWHEALAKALAELDPGSRSLIEARYYERESLSETAAAQGATERAIEGRLARVREKLRRSILHQLAARHEF